MIFTNVQYVFLEKEFGLSNESINQMDNDAFGDLYDKVCDIEIDETCKAGNNPLTERGETAVEIVDIMADALGYVQVDDADDDDPAA